MISDQIAAGASVTVDIPQGVDRVSIYARPNGGGSVTIEYANASIFTPLTDAPCNASGVSTAVVSNGFLTPISAVKFTATMGTVDYEVVY